MLQVQQQPHFVSPVLSEVEASRQEQEATGIRFTSPCGGSLQGGAVDFGCIEKQVFSQPLHQSLEIVGITAPLAVSWADTIESEGLALTVRSKQFDEEKMLLVGAILGISSPRRTTQLRDILQNFWESGQKESEEDIRVRRNRKRERELRNLHSSVNYDRSLAVVKSSGDQGGCR